MSKRNKRVIALIAVLLLGQIACTSARVDLTPDEHFDGKHFRNPPGEEVNKGLWEVLTWRWNREPPEWPEAAPTEPPVERRALGPNELRVTGIGHATVLLETHDFALLTDPIWSHTAGALPLLSPHRCRPPALPIEDLPAIDAVLISHNHYDHLDLPTLLQLEERDQPTFYVPLGDAGWLREEGLTAVVELDWWQAAAITPDVRLTATPARHWSGRMVIDSKLSLWCGFWIELNARQVFFAGDTGFGKHFEAVRKRLGIPDLALLPIGAYQPRSFMKPQHMNPADAVRAHHALEAKCSLGMHYDTFPLADEGFGSASAALAAEGLPEAAFAPIGFGVGHMISPRQPLPSSPSED